MTDYPLTEFGGSGPLMVISLANGFPPQTYRPLLDPLTDRCGPIRRRRTILLRGKIRGMTCCGHWTSIT